MTAAIPNPRWAPARPAVWLVLLLGAALLAGCPDRERDGATGVAVVGQGQQCGDSERGARWIEPDDAEGIEAESLGERRLLLISQGRRPTGGYGVRLDSARDAGDSVRIRIHLGEPGSDELVTQAITRPCLLLGIPASARTVELYDQHGDQLRELQR